MLLLEAHCPWPFTTVPQACQTTQPNLQHPEPLSNLRVNFIHTSSFATELLNNLRNLNSTDRQVPCRFPDLYYIKSRYRPFSPCGRSVGVHSHSFSYMLYMCRRLHKYTPSKTHEMKLQAIPRVSSLHRQVSFDIFFFYFLSLIVFQSLKLWLVSHPLLAFFQISSKTWEIF